ncbi:EF hand [Teladorsagia circumcincta]|uniref:EF hand n=1 Tax=Teladorsagia circumcincta TaxID=45464 RepID=A0A2G9UQ08_TELCI|nr:EF hand [Teladorsagia circumcincta]
MFDKENKGYIRATQVGQILRTMGQAFEERDLKQLIKEFDTDGSGEIEFEEFAAMVANFVVNSEDNEGLEEELREAFRLYDKQGNGYINVSDLRDILRALDENVSEEELDEMIAEIDTDGSGTVDFDGMNTQTLNLIKNTWVMCLIGKLSVRYDMPLRREPNPSTRSSSGILCILHRGYKEETLDGPAKTQACVPMEHRDKCAHCR